VPDTTATTPAGQPVSSPGTTVPTTTTTPPATGTGFVPGTTLLELISQPTTPTIFIATSYTANTFNGVSIQFDYLPESLSFGISAVFNPQPIPFTSGRWMTYDHSDVEEVSLTIKVVAGCNNCITYFNGNTTGSKYQQRGGLTSGKYERVSLIALAKMLYSLPLPGGNPNENWSPPPTCRLTVASMFSGPGAFSGCSINFNGPYDYDGSPTDMDVSLRFMPSEFYNSSVGQTGGVTSDMTPTASPTGSSQLTGNYPYAITFGDSKSAEGQATAGPETEHQKQEKIDAENKARALRVAQEQAAQYAQKYGYQTPLQSSGVNLRIPPISQTPTDPEVAATYGVALNQVHYDLASDTYKIDGRTGGSVVGQPEYFLGSKVRSDVHDYKIAHGEEYAPPKR